MRNSQASNADHVGSSSSDANPAAASLNTIPIDPATLTHLDYGLFRALVRLGTSKQRICSALCLSYAEYDHLSTTL